MQNVAPLLGDLVAINSINPDLVPGAPGEQAIAQYIAKWLTTAGLDVQLNESIPNRPNVIAIARGTGGGKTLLLNGHIDTVGIAGYPDALAPRIENDRMYGRGAYDMKCGVAACMLAIAEAKTHSLRGDIIFTAVVDEEYAGLGTASIATQYRADGAIVSEPTEQQLVVAHKGFVWFEIETHGIAAHGSRPDLGVDAIVSMGHFLVELEQLGLELRARPPHPLLGTPSLHASLIHGGQELSSYPDRCILSIERRTVPGETPATVESELQALIERLSRANPNFRATLTRGIDRTPLETPLDAAIVNAVETAASQIMQHPCDRRGVTYWTDAATLWAAGIPTVLFGPVGAGAHSIDEWVGLNSVNTCAEIYLQTILTFCQ